VNEGDAGVTTCDPENVAEALVLCRRVEAEAAGSPEVAKQATALAAEALALLPPGDRGRAALPEPSQLLLAVEALVEARKEEEALTLAETLDARLKAGPVDDAAAHERLACRLALARAKAHAQKRDRHQAFETIAAGAPRCEKYPDLHARDARPGAAIRSSPAGFQIYLSVNTWSPQTANELSCAGLPRPVRVFRVVAKIMFPNFTLGSGVFTQAPFRQKRQ
jgi:hypothetical protein